MMQLAGNPREVARAFGLKPHHIYRLIRSGHSLDFLTWRLLRRLGLTNEEAVELMIDLAKAT